MTLGPGLPGACRLIERAAVSILLGAGAARLIRTT
jgi:hypothetical protein